MKLGDALWVRLVDVGRPRLTGLSSCRSPRARRAGPVLPWNEGRIELVVADDGSATCGPTDDPPTRPAGQRPGRGVLVNHVRSLLAGRPNALTGPRTGRCDVRPARVASFSERTLTHPEACSTNATDRQSRIDSPLRTQVSPQPPSSSAPVPISAEPKSVTDTPSVIARAAARAVSVPPPALVGHHRGRRGGEEDPRAGIDDHQHHAARSVPAGRPNHSPGSPLPRPAGDAVEACAAPRRRGR